MHPQPEGPCGDEPKLPSPLPLLGLAPASEFVALLVSLPVVAAPPVALPAPVVAPLLVRFPEPLPLIDPPPVPVEATAIAPGGGVPL